MLEKITYRENCGLHCQLLEIKDYPIHYHTDAQLIYIFEGEIELRLSYSSYHLKKGDFHYVHPFDVHAIKSITGNNKILIINFQLEFYNRLFPDFENQVFFIRTEQSLKGEKLKSDLLLLVSDIVKSEIAIDFSEEDFNKKAINLINMFYEYFREYVISKDANTFDFKTSLNQHHSELIHKIITYIYENFREQLTLSNIAEQENINSYYLSHLIQHLVGENFRGIVGMVRVEMSERMLLESSLSISQISTEIGFSNSKYYVENFKIWFGCHPKEYRKTYSNEVLGKKPPVVNALDLKLLDFDDNNGSNVRSKINKTTLALTFDFKSIKPQKCQLINPAVFNISLPNSSLASNTPDRDLSSIYHECTGIQDCINALQKIVDHDSVPVLIDQLYDTSASLHGLYTINGLKKPMYYFSPFLPYICADPIEKQSNYIFSHYNGDYYLTLFNDSEYIDIFYNITFSNLPCNKKITEHLFSNMHTCFTLWNQLNYKNILTESEIEMISSMSIPEISFTLLSVNKKQLFETTINPKNIIVLQISDYE